MSEGETNRLSRRLTPRTNRFIPIEFTVRQSIFLLLDDVLEVLFGGAAGGGKSEGILASAAQYVDVPEYSALIFRRTFRDLALPGALMSRSKQWWASTDAKYDSQNYKWTFPSGATIQFGYMEHDGDWLRYQSSEFQYIGFDELSQFPQEAYLYMFSRLRRLRGSDVPIRMRGATNPGGPGHAWVKKRWNLPSGRTGDRNRVFVPSFLDDNPHLDQHVYEISMSQLSEMTYAQLRRGDWDAQAFGGKFDPAWFQVIDRGDVPEAVYWERQVRHWDLASSRPTEDNPDPDWTAGARVIRVSRLPTRTLERLKDLGSEIPPPPYWVIMDVARTRQDAGGVEEFVSAHAHSDGRIVPVSFEQERGASGKLVIESYRRHVLPGFRISRLWAQGDKESRARPVAARAREGKVFIVDGPWVEPFLDEVGLFGIKDVHDDQIDAVSGAFHQLDKLDHLMVASDIEQY